MLQRDENYLTMGKTTVSVLDKNVSIWQSNVAVTNLVNKVKAEILLIDQAQQGSGKISTGATLDKEVAGDMAIEMAVRLAGVGQAYALDNNNNQLHDQLKVSYTRLDSLPDNILGATLRLLHKNLNNIAGDLLSYGITADALAEFEAAIENFENVNTTPRVIIAERKGHNASIPTLLRKLRSHFYNLDRLVKIWENTEPKFVSDYQTARIVIDLGTRHKKDDDNSGPANGNP